MAPILSAISADAEASLTAAAADAILNRPAARRSGLR